MPKVTHIYTIYDSVAQEFGPIFEAPNDGIAQRAKRGLLKQVDPSSVAEFILYRVGSYEVQEEKLVVSGCEMISAEVIEHE